MTVASNCAGAVSISHIVVDNIYEWQKTLPLFVLGVAALLVFLLYSLLTRIFEQKVDVYFLRRPTESKINVLAAETSTHVSRLETISRCKMEKHIN